MYTNIILLLLYASIKSVFSQGAGGPYEVEYTMVCDCPDIAKDAESEALWAAKVTCVRLNESISYMNGEIEFKKDVPCGTKAVIEVEKEANGKREKMMSTVIQNICDELENPDSPYDKMLRDLKLKKSGIPAGIIEMRNISVDTEAVPKDSSSVGDYNNHLCMMNSENELLGCLTVHCLIERLP